MTREALNRSEFSAEPSWMIPFSTGTRPPSTSSQETGLVQSSRRTHACGHVVLVNHAEKAAGSLVPRRFRNFAGQVIGLSESESAWRNWSTEKSTSANTKNFAILKM